MNVIVALSILRVVLSVVAAAFAFSLNRFYKGGLLANSWWFLVAAAVLQAFAGVGEITQLAGNRTSGEIIERASDILSVLMLLMFTIEHKLAWARLRV